MTLKVKRLLYDVQAANTSGRLDTDFPHNQVATNLNRELGEKKNGPNSGLPKPVKKNEEEEEKEEQEREGRKEKEKGKGKEVVRKKGENPTEMWFLCY